MSKAGESFTSDDGAAFRAHAGPLAPRDTDEEPRLKFYDPNVDRASLTEYQRAGLEARGWIRWPALILGTFEWTRAPGEFGPYAEEGGIGWDTTLAEINAQQPAPDDEDIEAEAHRRFPAHYDGFAEGQSQRGLAEDANPKDKAALDKVPMWTLPAIGAVHGAMATGEGVRKEYGAFNWRYKPISMNEHIAAIERHIAAIKDGEDYVRDSEGRRVTHLGCINAGTAIILDARQCGTLIDDRPESPTITSADELEAYRERNKR